MTIRVAINGFGRIGRMIVRALYESDRSDEFELVAINDLGEPAINAHLLKFDSVHGVFAPEVEHEDNALFIDGKPIKIYQVTDPSSLPWKLDNIDIVFECTGRFTTRNLACKHLKSGARRVLVSAPCENADATIVYGVNHHTLKATDLVVSNASCTTNSIAPMIKVLQDSIGIEEGMMTTIHSYTNDQHLTDGYHHDPYRTRAAAASMIPTKTGAATAVAEVIPELEGRLTGLAVRVPTVNVSLVDLSFIPSRNTSVEEVNALMKEAAQGSLKGVLEYNVLPLVSVDFNHNSASCIFDAKQTRVGQNMVKVFGWYDNEWAFSNRMLDTAAAMLGDTA